MVDHQGRADLAGYARNGRYAYVWPFDAYAGNAFGEADGCPEKGEELCVRPAVLKRMIQHHNGALIMVKDLFDTPGAGQDAELFNFATDVDSGQRAEIRIMQTMLAQKP